MTGVYIILSEPLRRQFVWKDKAYFLGKIRTKQSTYRLLELLASKLSGNEYIISRQQSKPDSGNQKRFFSWYECSEVTKLSASEIAIFHSVNLLKLEFLNIEANLGFLVWILHITFLLLYVQIHISPEKKAQRSENVTHRMCERRWSWSDCAFAVRSGSTSSATFRIRPKYRTYPYKSTVKQFRSFQITVCVLLPNALYVVGTH